MKKWIATATLIVLSAGTGFTQDVERGASIFKRCQVCQAIGPSAQNKVERCWVAQSSRSHATSAVTRAS